MSNLQRQVVHFTPDVGKAKVLSAKEKIAQLNPDVSVVTYRQLLTADNAADIIKDYDFVVSATDNFAAKFLVNDVCVQMGKAFSQGGVSHFEGQTMTYLPGTACYRCLFEDTAQKQPVKTGILGAVAGMLGTIQATETLKYITKCGEHLANKLLMVDAKTMTFQTLHIKKNPVCPVCAH
jgi:molybdopterin/thiamine biosynthesis adenylyltransferase